MVISPGEGKKKAFYLHIKKGYVNNLYFLFILYYLFLFYYVFIRCRVGTLFINLYITLRDSLTEVRV